jgi:hypothetical protein
MRPRREDEPVSGLVACDPSATHGEKPLIRVVIDEVVNWAKVIPRAHEVVHEAGDEMTDGNRLFVALPSIN